MTIKIITKGVNPKAILLRGSCYNCKTVVECSKDDAKNTYDQRDGNSWSVVCPVCSGSIYLVEYEPHDGRGPG